MSRLFEPKDPYDDRPTTSMNSLLDRQVRNLNITAPLARISEFGSGKKSLNKKLEKMTTGRFQKSAVPDISEAGDLMREVNGQKLSTEKLVKKHPIFKCIKKYFTD